MLSHFSCVWLFASPWTIAFQGPLPMEFSRQEFWSGLPLPSPGDLPDPGSNPGLLHCRSILYYLSHQGSPNRACVCVLVAQMCPTLCDPMDYSSPGSSDHGMFQARILEWVAISLSRGSSRPRDWTQVSGIPGRFFTIWAGKPHR